MKNTIKNLIAVVLCLSVLTILPLRGVSPAAGRAAAAEHIDGYINDILAFQLKQTNTKNIQTFINKTVTDGAAGSYDWYAFGLMQSGSPYDFSAYARALAKNSKTNNHFNAVEKERCCLILTAFGTEDAFIADTLDTCTGELGIMSYIFALHIMNTGISCTRFSARETTETLLGMRSPEGGWSLTGTGIDPDVTAMTIQAIAPYYQTDEKVKIAVDEALKNLSSAQTENGGFRSYGTENPESCAQVLIALTSLGISPFADERFIKNGNTVLDAMLSFRLGDGSFEHFRGKGYNFKATEQAFYALVALQRYIEGKTPFFLPDKHTLTPPKPTEEKTTKKPSGKPSSPTTQTEKTTRTDPRSETASAATTTAVVTEKTDVTTAPQSTTSPRPAEPSRSLQEGTTTPATRAAQTATTATATAVSDNSTVPPVSVESSAIEEPASVSFPEQTSEESISSFSNENLLPGNNAGDAKKVIEFLDSALRFFGAGVIITLLVITTLIVALIVFLKKKHKK